MPTMQAEVSVECSKPAMLQGKNRYWAVTKRISAGIQSKPYWILLLELERKAAFAAAKQLSSPHAK
jgi:hypothetical protein